MNRRNIFTITPEQARIIVVDWRRALLFRCL